MAESSGVVKSRGGRAVPSLNLKPPPALRGALPVARTAVVDPLVVYCLQMVRTARSRDARRLYTQFLRDHMTLLQRGRGLGLQRLVAAADIS